MRYKYAIFIGCNPPQEIPKLPHEIEADTTGDAAVQAIKSRPDLLQMAVEQSLPPGDAPGVWVALAGDDFPKHPNGRFSQIMMVGLRIYRGIDCYA